MVKPLSIYIHIPFCNKRCDYCHFYVVTGLNELIPQYVTSVIAEIKAAQKKLTNYEITTIYFGGGTPSLLNAQQVREILTAIRDTATVIENPEITLESNPEDLSLEKLTGFRSAGINRLSIGLQAAQNHLLKYLGRTYTHEQFENLIAAVKTAGFINYNIDLIFGIPNQTKTEWSESLAFALTFQPTHLSCYSLELDHQSVMGQQYRQGLITPPTDEENRELYQLTKTQLASAGYQHYELSNWAQPGFECQHNLNFWKNQFYLGFGAGAHSFFENQTWSNVPIVKKYLAQSKQADQQIELTRLTEPELSQQAIILGLRLVRGISVDKIPLTLQQTLKKLAAQRFIQFDGTYFSLTKLGQDTFDEVARQIFTI